MSEIELLEKIAKIKNLLEIQNICFRGNLEIMDERQCIYDRGAIDAYLKILELFGENQ